MLNKDNLRTLHIEESVIKHLTEVVRNNPDPRSLLTREINPLTPISPIVAAHIRDKKTKRALIRMGIYNLMCLGYENKCWSFAIQFTSHQYEIINVGRNETDTPILFGDAILLGIIRAIKARNQKLNEIAEKVEAIENEINYDDESELSNKQVNQTNVDVGIMPPVNIDDISITKDILSPDVRPEIDLNPIDDNTALQIVNVLNEVNQPPILICSEDESRLKLNEQDIGSLLKTDVIPEIRIGSGLRRK